MANNKKAPARKIITADDDGMGATLARMAAMVGRLREGEGAQEYAARAPEIIRQHVHTIAEAARGVDAFDLIELTRMYEMPLRLEGYRESLAQYLPVAVEIVALVMLSRGQRFPEDEPQVDGIEAVVEDLHERVSEMLLASSFSLLASGMQNEHGPLTMLSAQYVGMNSSVRGKQYTHIHDEINEALFASVHIGDLLKGSLGFTFEEFISVREAITQVRSEKMFSGVDVMRELFEQYQNRVSEQPDGAFKAKLSELRDAWKAPASRATFTAAEVADAASVPIETTQLVLYTFSAGFDEAFDAATAVQALLAGDSPFRTAGLVRDADGNYVSMGSPIGTDCFRQVAEEALNQNSKRFRTYERRRVSVSEEYALAHLSKLLGSNASHPNLKYFRANRDVEVSALGKGAENLTAIADQTEADGLFLIEDVAICVEVKGKSLSRQARAGHVQRLSADLKATIGSATQQAQRLEEHIRVNGGLWLEDRSWWDLSEIREIRSVAVCIDDLGPLATGLDALVRANVITSDRFPWIVSLHDLMVVADVVDRPAEFLLYLRRRTESEVSLRFEALDELDLFMLFLQGGLYVDPDPERVSEEFLGVPRPTGRDRRRYRDAAVPTQVSTHTDLLDAWIYYANGASEEPAPKPKFLTDARVNQLVNFLQEDRKPGWFRFSADLLNLSSEGQEGVAHALEHVAALTAKDGSAHTSFTAFAGAWGYPTLFIGTKPALMPAAAASEHLVRYAVLKKHQIKSDRALMVLIDEKEKIHSIRYDSSEPVDDATLDDAAALMRLIPPEVMGRRIPPSARRTTKRLNPKKKRKKR